MRAARHARGFSVLEAAIALVVVGLVATSIVTAGPAEARLADAARDEAAAWRTAQALLEVARVAPPSPGDDGPAVLPDGVAAAPRGATLTRRVERVEAGLLRVEACVRFGSDATGAAREVRLATYIAVEDAP